MMQNFRLAAIESSRRPKWRNLPLAKAIRAKLCLSSFLMRKAPLNQGTAPSPNAPKLFLARRIAGRRRAACKWQAKAHFSSS